MAALKCRAPLQSFGIWMLGPALLKYGSEEQKRHYLPQIARGEIRWCQGYSEPNAGSDLASLATRAEVHDDHFVVTGQKVWTSYADKADWIFCLVRTDSAKKHTGISFVLIDMTSPGISTKPIQLISGASPFCETFFDRSEGAACQPGGRTQRAAGPIAKYLLHARARNDRRHRRACGAAAGGPLRRRASRPRRSRAASTIRCCAARSRASRSTKRRFAPGCKMVGEQARAGEAHPALSSALKYYGAELNKRRWELMMAIGGADALEWEGERSPQGAAARTWLRSKANSIEGGTSEVQLNVVAKRILGLPGA